MSEHITLLQHTVVIQWRRKSPQIEKEGEEGGKRNLIGLCIVHSMMASIYLLFSVTQFVDNLTVIQVEKFGDGIDSIHYD